MSVIWNLVGALLGALVTWLVSRTYYIRASADLTKEAGELRRLTTLILRALEEAKLARLERDARGAITGLKLFEEATLTARAVLTSEESIRPTPTKP